MPRADGSRVYHHMKVLTPHIHMAMNRTYGESFITHGPRYQTLEVYKPYTRQKDGSIVKTFDNVFVEVLSAAATNTPAFNALWEMIAVHTGLELDATVYLDYSITNKPGYLPRINVHRQLEQFSPAEEYKISTVVPQGQRLEYALDSLKSKPFATEKEGMK